MFGQCVSCVACVCYVRCVCCVSGLRLRYDTPRRMYGMKYVCLICCVDPFCAFVYVCFVYISCFQRCVVSRRL
ncbi:hypothetical protein LZ30DRAFT_389222 [Colletotrichum cereale]|nr:hypothetical protein LZ30DRAFT_389222 [Colletotrichum cereale]